MNRFDEDYARETNLGHMISRIGTASTRSFENKPRIVRKKPVRLTKPVCMMSGVAVFRTFMNEMIEMISFRLIWKVILFQC